VIVGCGCGLALSEGQQITLMISSTVALALLWWCKLLACTHYCLSGMLLYDRQLCCDDGLLQMLGC
jgi:hypothetical protein